MQAGCSGKATRTCLNSPAKGLRSDFLLALTGEAGSRCLEPILIGRESFTRGMIRCSTRIIVSLRTTREIR